MKLFLIILGIWSSIISTRCLQFIVLNTGNVYQFSADENSGGSGESLGTVTCTGPGGGALNGPVTYSILDPGSVPFTLDSSTGVLTLRNGQVLDYEQAISYDFTVSCFYVNDSYNNATATVRFSVLPVNEFPADFSDRSLIVTIYESNPPGTVLVSRDFSGSRQYSASDADRGPDGEVRFLSNNNNTSSFELNEMTGALTLTQSIDLDSGVVGLLRITYTILACDGDRPPVECNSLAVIILVRPANNNPPVFEQDEYSIAIPETTPVGTSLITVVCTDADRHGVGEFSGITVDPADAPVFIPNESNGTVFNREPLDFETFGNRIVVTLVCRDTGFLQANATFTISVISQNDNEPQFQRTTYKFAFNRISPIGQMVGQVVATDVDQDSLTYKVSGLGSENFQIAEDGLITVSDYIYVFEGSHFELIVTAHDGMFSHSTKVTINVTGGLSIPEIIIVTVILIGLVVVYLVLVFLAFCTRCCKRSKQRYRSESCSTKDTEMWSSATTDISKAKSAGLNESHSV